MDLYLLVFTSPNGYLGYIGNTASTTLCSLHSQVSASRIYSRLWLADCVFKELFAVTYGFKPGPSGLAYLGLGMGFLISTVFGGQVGDRIYQTVSTASLLVDPFCGLQSCSSITPLLLRCLRAMGARASQSSAFLHLSSGRSLCPSACCKYRFRELGLSGIQR